MSSWFSSEPPPTGLFGFSIKGEMFGAAAVVGGGLAFLGAPVLVTIGAASGTVFMMRNAFDSVLNSWSTSQRQVEVLSVPASTVVAAIALAAGASFAYSSLFSKGAAG